MAGVERINLQSAYVLYRRPYRESSLLLDVFTPQFGRLGVIAKGAQRSRTRQGGLLQAFTPLLLSWSRRGELATLTDAEMAAPPWGLKGPDLISGFYLNELLIRLLGRDDPHAELYTSYQTTLQRLAAEDFNSEWALRLFEKSLLETLGYGLLLEHECESGAEISADTRYCYYLEKGPLSRYDEPGDGLLLHGATLLALADGTQPKPFMLGEAKRLMRRTLELYLGDRPIRTREVFRQTYKKQP